MNPIRFYFDFTSTFSYVAIQKIDEIANRFGRAVDWRAISLGHLFQAQWVEASLPKKMAYLEIDFPRSCAFLGLPGKLPSPYPPDVKLARSVFWYLKARDEQRSHAFARRITMTLFGEGKSVATAEHIAASYPEITGDEIAAAAKDQGVKTAISVALDQAKEDGLIGVPFILVDGEPFWGSDRLDQLTARLSKR